MPQITYYKEKDLVLLQSKEKARIVDIQYFTEKPPKYEIRVLNKGESRKITSDKIIEKIPTKGGYGDNEVILSESTLDTMFCELQGFLSKECEELFYAFQRKLHGELKDLGFNLRN